VEIPGLSSLFAVAEVPLEFSKATNQLPVALIASITEGLGPMVGSKAYAQDRLRLAEGEEEAAITRVLKESIGAAESRDFARAVGKMADTGSQIPTEVAGIAVINARMVGAIAELRGWDTDDPHVQSIVLMLVSGTSAPVVARAVTTLLGSKMTTNTVLRMSTGVLKELNKRLGVMLLAQYGSQKVAGELAKQIPFVGPLASTAVDSSLTKSVGDAAVKVFLR
jgi:uncharacterized protein (DUF697 family)